MLDRIEDDGPHIVIVERKAPLQKEAIEVLPDKAWVENVTSTAKFLAVLGCAAGLVICAFSLWLVFLSDDSAASTIDMFGQKVQTDSVGVAGLGIGAIIVGLTLTKVFKFLGDQLSR